MDHGIHNNFDEDAWSWEIDLMYNLVNLGPTIGAEIKKARPYIVISPDELNAHIGTVIVVPITTVFREHYPFRATCVFQG